MTNMSVTPNQYPIIGIEALKGGGGVLLSNRLVGMCWHIYDFTDNSGVAFSIKLLEWGLTFSRFWL